LTEILEFQRGVTTALNTTLSPRREELRNSHGRLTRAPRTAFLLENLLVLENGALTIAEADHWESEAVKDLLPKLQPI